MQSGRFVNEKSEVKNRNGNSTRGGGFSKAAEHLTTHTKRGGVATEVETEVEVEVGVEVRRDTQAAQSGIFYRPGPHKSPRT